jgi:hypothetical protein
VGVGRLPGLDVYAGDGLGVLRCCPADHAPEPTLEP